MRDRTAYNPHACCGLDCFAFGVREDEPCWGSVEAIEEVTTEDGSHAWVHACQGHLNTWDSDEKYKLVPEAE